MPDNERLEEREPLLGIASIHETRRDDNGKFELSELSTLPRSKSLSQRLRGYSSGPWRLARHRLGIATDKWDQQQSDMN